MENTHYAAECHNKEHDEEAKLTFTDDKESALMLSVKMLDLLILNEEKIMANLLVEGEDQMKTNNWYLENGASNHMIKDRAKFKKLDEIFIRSMKLCDRSIVTIQGKGSFLFQRRTAITF